MSDEAAATRSRSGAGARPERADRQADAHDPQPAVLRDCAEAEAYVASVCFKHGPPRLLGVELEWLLERTSDRQAPIDVDTLRGALGEHTPTMLTPGSPALPLPSGSTVTLEPGGQVELASAPLPDLAALVHATRADIDVLHGLLAGAGLRAQARAADPHRPPVRILEAPRYRAMEQVFDRFGPYGRSAMSSTAAVQVCVDAGEGADVARRWAALHTFGPVLLAAFANSPRLHGRRTGWKSSRWACWMRADPARTAPPPRADIATADPAAAWARRVLASPVLCVRNSVDRGVDRGVDGGVDRSGNGDGRAGEDWLVPEQMSFAAWIQGALPVAPTVADLDYHVSTLFPPVRPHGHLEVRYVDGQPGRHWALPPAVVTALLSDPEITDAAQEACEPAQGRWVSAARHGLADRVLARAAATVFGLACARLPAIDAPAWVTDDLIDMTERQVLRGRCPADYPALSANPGSGIPHPDPTAPR